MPYSFNLLLGLATLAVPGLMIGPARAQYSIKTIDVPGALHLTEAYDLNDAGQVAGYYSDFNGGHGFVDDAGTFKTIDAPNASGYFGTAVFGINNLGQTVGTYTTSVTVAHGFLKSGGTFTTIDAPNGLNTEASDINDAGQIVGDANVGGGHRGFLDNGGTFTEIQDPNAPDETFVKRINNTGQIVGWYFDGSSDHGFLDSGSIFTTVDYPVASVNSTLSGINDAGQIVGNYQDAAGIFHGFVDINGTFTTLDVPNAVYGTYAFGINNDGQIAGYYTDANGDHGFLATLNGPVPEASTTVSFGLLLAFGMGGVVIASRKKKAATAA